MTTETSLSPLRIALFGATDGTGRQVLAQALEQGHGVRVLMRDPTKLSEQLGLTRIVGDVLDPEATQRCVEGTDAVIGVLGSRHGSREPVEAVGTGRILEAMQSLGVRRLIAVTSLGVGDSRAQINPLFRVIMDLTLKPHPDRPERAPGLHRCPKFRAGWRASASGI